MNNIKAKLEKELEFAKKMKMEYGDKIVFEPKLRSAHLAMYDFYNGMEEALINAITIVEEESTK